MDGTWHINTALQSQKAATAHLKKKQLLPLVFVRNKNNLIKDTFLSKWQMSEW